MNTKAIVRNSIELLHCELDDMLPKATERNINVLYIDDELSNLTALRSLFRREKFNVFIADNIHDALGIIKRENIQVVITDYKMPGKNGAECMEIIHRTNPNIIGVALSAYSTVDIEKEFKEKGDVLRFIKKPFNFNELKATIIDSYKLYIFKISNQCINHIDLD